MTACRNIVAINYNSAMINPPRIPWLVITCSVIKEKDETYRESLCEEKRITLTSFLSWAVNGGLCSPDENSACPTNFSMVTAVMSTQHCPQAARCHGAVQILHGNVCAQLVVCHKRFHKRCYLNTSQLTKRPSPLSYVNSCRISWISYSFIQNFKNLTYASG